MASENRAAPRLGRYRLLRRIGEGGMCEVYLGAADAEGSLKPVALKRLRPSLRGDQAVVAALLGEARLATRLQHGSIAQVHEVGLEDGLPYLVVEHVDGVSLAELARSRSIDLPSALHVVEHVAAALDYAHRLRDEQGAGAGVIHRDVKPGNILVSRDGVVKLTDFGLAKALGLPGATQPGTVKGTLGYLAPEQARGDDLDARADQFALGLILYELLAGQNPLVTVQSLEEYMRRQETGLPPFEPRPPVDAALAAIVARATARRPDARYPSVADFRADLESWRVGRGIRAGPESLARAVRAIARESGAELRPFEAALVGIDPRADTMHLTAGARRAAPRVAPFVAAVVILGGGTFAAYRWTRPRGTAATPPVSAPATATAPAPVSAPASASAPDLPSAPPTSTRTSTTASAPGSAPTVPKAGPIRPAPRERAPGRLRVNVLPWAQVYVDDRLRGQTPLELALPAGVHRIRLVNPDRALSAVRTVRIEAGGEARISSWE